MRRIRVIPALLIREGGLVKTVRFRDPNYLGDPINAVKVYNDKEVDELLILDIAATSGGREPNLEHIREICSEAFMPFGYGGGVTTVEQARQILASGVEKIVLNTATVRTPKLITECAERFGSQAVVASIDVRKAMFGGQKVVIAGGREKTGLDPVEHARQVTAAGAGEILLNSVDRDGTYQGYDLDLIGAISAAVEIPVVALGGARGTDDFLAAVRSGAAAVAAGSLFSYQGSRDGVLINYPPQQTLRSELFEPLDREHP